MGRLRGRWICHLLIVACLAAGCGRRTRRQAAIGEAYVAPISLNLRQELAPRAPVTAAVKHGERLEILEKRRRFAKVRTAQGAEGWTDGRQLLSPEGMAKLRRANEKARNRPSQGKAMPFDLLNVHIEPNRSAPSFHQIPEDGVVDVIERAVTARAPYAPDNGGPPEPPTANPIKDDWSLVRLPDGRSGWVLSRMLLLNLPDEVTQYAEGHRITSYFAIGSVNDRGQARHHYLWTTIAIPPEEYQFDSLRVFVWNARRHRYETTYVERGLKGYYPATAGPNENGEMRIRLICSGRDGQLHQRVYSFRENRFRLVEKIPWQLRQQEEEHPPPAVEEKKAEGTRWERVREWWNSRWRKSPAPAQTR